MVKQAVRKKKLSNLRGKLIQKRRKILKELEAELDTSQKLSEQLSRDDADAASDILESQLALRLAELESQEMERIDDALQRIEEGSYGVCQECGGKISSERLRAMPSSTLCVKCKEAEEKQSRGSRDSGTIAEWVDTEGSMDEDLKFHDQFVPKRGRKLA